MYSYRRGTAYNKLETVPLPHSPPSRFSRLVHHHLLRLLMRNLDSLRYGSMRRARRMHCRTMHLSLRLSRLRAPVHRSSSSQQRFMIPLRLLLTHNALKRFLPILRRYSRMLQCREFLRVELAEEERGCCGVCEGVGWWCED